MSSTIPRSVRSYVKLNESDWNTIVAAYASGSDTIAELSDRYGVSQRAVQSHLSKALPKAAPKRSGRVAAIRTLAIAIAAPHDIEGRSAETREAAYTGAAAIQSLILDVLAEASELPPAARMRLADAGAVALERCHKIRRLVLGITAQSEDSERELTELPIRELTNEEVAAMRAAQVAEDEESGYVAQPVERDENTTDEDNIVSEGGTDAAVVSSAEVKLPSKRATLGWL